VSQAARARQRQAPQGSKCACMHRAGGRADRLACTRAPSVGRGPRGGEVGDVVDVVLEAKGALLHVVAGADRDAALGRGGRDDGVVPLRARVARREDDERVRVVVHELVYHHGVARVAVAAGGRGGGVIVIVRYRWLNR